ncbi:MAG: hypothetical protein HKP13_09210 [Gammaproteobacteria bacterium]|nr:hypothetical protein [Gammaproteobacteria bacterium]
MIEDPVVEEIRKYRAEHAAHYGNDLRKICEALRKQEKKSQKEFVDFGPKLLQTKNMAACKSQQVPSDQNM